MSASVTGYHDAASAVVPSKSHFLEYVSFNRSPRETLWNVKSRWEITEWDHIPMNARVCHPNYDCVSSTIFLQLASTPLEMNETNAKLEVNRALGRLSRNRAALKVIVR